MLTRERPLPSFKLLVDVFVDAGDLTVRADYHRGTIRHLAVGDERARELALTGGDDYELCFTVNPGNVARLRQELPPERWGYSPIGTVREAAGSVVLKDGNVMEFAHSGYDHVGK